MSASDSQDVVRENLKELQILLCLDSIIKMIVKLSFDTEKSKTRENNIMHGQSELPKEFWC